MKTAINLSAVLAITLSAGAALAQCESSCTASGGVAVTQAQYVKKGDIVDTAVRAGQFNTLAAALKAAGLVDVLKGEGPFTVFAPTDEAFARLPAGTVETLLKPENKDKLIAILTYHVVPGKADAKTVLGQNAWGTVNGQRVEIAQRGGSAMIDGAKIVKTDIDCTNGVIHVIDSVILPETRTIPEVAAEAGSFNTLLAAAKAAGLVGALSGEGPITVFAPTDEAFAKLPAGTVEGLLKPENKDKLAAILAYHVVEGRVFSTDLPASGNAKTLGGGSIAIKSDSHGVKINNAKVVQADIDASNGVIHIIDTVLLPN